MFWAVINTRGEIIALFKHQSHATVMPVRFGWNPADYKIEIRFYEPTPDTVL